MGSSKKEAGILLRLVDEMRKHLFAHEHGSFVDVGGEITDEGLRFIFTVPSLGFVRREDDPRYLQSVALIRHMMVDMEEAMGGLYEAPYCVDRPRALHHTDHRAPRFDRFHRCSWIYEMERIEADIA